MFTGTYVKVFYGNGKVKLDTDGTFSRLRINYLIDGDFDISVPKTWAYTTFKKNNAISIISRIRNQELSGTILKYTGSIKIHSVKINNAFSIYPRETAYEGGATIPNDKGYILKLEDTIRNIGASVTISSDPKKIADYSSKIFTRKTWRKYRKRGNFYGLLAPGSSKVKKVKYRPTTRVKSKFSRRGGY